MLDRYMTIASAIAVLISAAVILGHVTPRAMARAVHDARMYHHMSVGVE